MMVMPSGISAPPPSPWSVRQTISTVIDGANPDSTDPTRKIAKSGEVHAPPAIEVRESPPERHGDRRGEDVAPRRPTSRWRGRPGSRSPSAWRSRRRSTPWRRGRAPASRPRRRARGGAAARAVTVRSLAGAMAHWAHGHCRRRSAYGSAESCPSCQTTRSAAASRRISVGQAAGAAGQAPHGQAARSVSKG